MLAALGYRVARGADRRDRAGGDPRAARRWRCPRRCPRPRRCDSVEAIAARNKVAEIVHRPGLLRHAHAGRHPAQHPRESGVVHGLHAVPAGDLAGPPRSAGQLPDDGLRPDRHGDRQRVDARRGDRRGRGDDAGAAHRQERRAAVSSSPTTCFRRRSTSCARARRRSASRSSSGRRAARRRRRMPFAVLLQYPGANGDVRDYRALAADAAREAARSSIVAADLLALTLLAPPGEWGADAVVGSTQRFGVPMGYGGPHAGYLATRDEFKRSMPGRLVGVTVDAQRRRRVSARAADARAAHPAREGDVQHLHGAGAARGDRQHVRASITAPDGLTRIARRVHRLTAILEGRARAARLRRADRRRSSTRSRVVTGDTHDRDRRARRGRGHQLPPRRRGHARHFARRDDDARRRRDDLAQVFAAADAPFTVDELDAAIDDDLPPALARTSAFLTHPVFHRYRSETEMLRYLRRLADRDLALDRAMIPLGSCTMKLNATSEMIPVTWPEFGALHPFAPAEQAAGYRELIARARADALRGHRLRRGVAAAQRRARRASTRGC